MHLTNKCHSQSVLSGLYAFQHFGRCCMPSADQAGGVHLPSDHLLHEAGNSVTVHHTSCKSKVPEPQFLQVNSGRRAMNPKYGDITTCPHKELANIPSSRNPYGLRKKINSPVHGEIHFLLNSITLSVINQMNCRVASCWQTSRRCSFISITKSARGENLQAETITTRPTGPTPTIAIVIPELMPTSRSPSSRPVGYMSEHIT